MVATRSWIDPTPAPASALALLGERPLVLHERLVRRLRAPAENGAQRVAHGAHVPAPDPGPFRRLDDHDLARRREDQLVDPVEVHVGDPDPVRSGCRAGRSSSAVGGILGRDQVLVGGQPHVADVDPPKRPCQ